MNTVAFEFVNSDPGIRILFTHNRTYLDPQIGAMQRNDVMFKTATVNTPRKRQQSVFSPAQQQFSDNRQYSNWPRHRHIADTSLSACFTASASLTSIQAAAWRNAATWRPAASKRSTSCGTSVRPSGKIHSHASGLKTYVPLEIQIGFTGFSAYCCTQSSANTNSPNGIRNGS